MGTQLSASGIIPALITSFDENGNFDEARTREVTRSLLQEDIGALYITGSTGEAFLMSTQERKQATLAVMEEVAGRLPVIVHVGAISTDASIQLAQYARDLGAAALSSVPPFYWKFSEEAVYTYYRDLCAATQLPFVVYNVPMAGLMTTQFIQRLAGLETVCGVKYTATTQHDILLLKEALGAAFLVYSGCDEMGVSGLLYGADGLIGSFYNLMPELYVKLEQAFRRGEVLRAAEYQRQADLVIQKALTYDYYALIKMAMGWKGVDAGFCRKPFARYTSGQEQEMRRDFLELRERHNLRDIAFLNAL